MPVLWTRKEIEIFERDFRCIICLKMPMNPHICNQCSHHFCKSCISRAYTVYNMDSCPHCRYYVFVKMKL